MSATSAAREFLDSARVTDADLEAYREIINPGRNVVSILEFHLNVSRRLAGLVECGDALPWSKTAKNFHLRPGEVTLWHGINGHGKSAVTGQVALWLALHDRKVCLASFEMLPEMTLERMVKQAAGNPMPSEKFIGEFFEGLCQRMWIYDRHGRVDQRMLFAAMRYCAKEKQTSHFFVDSLMKCVPKEDDYGAQSDFVNALCDVAHETKMHIHLVHHVRKGSDEKSPPGKFDARGAGAITDQVDNVIAVWRNKDKERERDKCLQMGAALTDESPDFLLICDKQRNGDWEGVWALWGDAQSKHFRETKDQSWKRGYDLPGYVQMQEEPGAAG